MRSTPLSLNASFFHFQNVLALVGEEGRHSCARLRAESGAGVRQVAKRAWGPGAPRRGEGVNPSQTPGGKRGGAQEWGAGAPGCRGVVEQECTRLRSKSGAPQVGCDLAKVEW